MAWLLGSERCGVLAAVVAWLAGCGTVTPVPRMGPHTEKDTLVDVESLPPEPVRVEQVPPRPTEQSVWVDGFWHWAGRRWEWVEGGWQIPPEGAYYARSKIVRMPVAVYDKEEGTGERVLRGYGMTLMYLPGHWHLPDGRVVGDPQRKRRQGRGGNRAGGP